MTARRKSSLMKGIRPKQVRAPAREIFDSARSDQRAESEGRVESSHSESEATLVDARNGAPHRRLAELQAKLAEAHEALARQHQEREEDAESFARMMTRLSQTERTLGQSKSKLVDAEARAEAAEAETLKLQQRLAESEAAASERERAAQADWHAERERVQAESQTLRERLESELRAERERFELELSKERERNRELEVERKEQDQGRREEIAQALECAKQLAAQVDASNVELETRMAELEASKADASAKERALSELTAEHDALKSELERLRSEMMQRQTANESALEDLRAQFDVRAGQLGQVREKLALAREREKQLIATAEATKRELLEAEKSRISLAQAVAAMEAFALEIKQLGVEARAYQAKVSNNEDASKQDQPEMHAPEQAPFQTRLSDAPEILVDGVTLGEERKASESSLPTLRPVVRSAS